MRHGTSLFSHFLHQGFQTLFHVYAFYFGGLRLRHVLLTGGLQHYCVCYFRREVTSCRTRPSAPEIDPLDFNDQQHQQDSKVNRDYPPCGPNLRVDEDVRNLREKLTNSSHQDLRLFTALVHLDIIIRESGERNATASKSAGESSSVPLKTNL